MESEYLTSLAPEVGGAGIDLLVGAVGGFISAWWLKRKMRIEASAQLSMRRLRRPEISIQEVIGLSVHNREFGSLDVHADEGRVSYQSLVNCNFASHSSPSKFSGFVITESEFRKCLFATGSEGSEFFDVFFENSIIAGCSFRRCKFTSSELSNIFAGSKVITCDFSLAKFSGVSLDSATFEGCMFWGCTFENNADLPQDHYKFLDEIGAVEAIENGFRILKFGQFMMSSQSRRWKYLRYRARQVLH